MLLFPLQMVGKLVIDFVKLQKHYFIKVKSPEMPKKRVNAQ